jgi:hypothetical protein
MFSITYVDCVFANGSRDGAQSVLAPAMVDGARVLDIKLTGAAGPQWRSDWSWAREVSVFAGPAGRFFSDRYH